MSILLLKCDICGTEFDHTEAGDCDCGMGCGGVNVKCPECGIHVILPPELQELKKHEKNSKNMLDQLEKELGLKFD